MRCAVDRDIWQIEGLSIDLPIDRIGDTFAKLVTLDIASGENGLMCIGTSAQIIVMIRRYRSVRGRSGSLLKWRKASREDRASHLNENREEESEKNPAYQ